MILDQLRSVHIEYCEVTAEKSFEGRKIESRQVQRFKNRCISDCVLVARRGEQAFCCLNLDFDSGTCLQGAEEVHIHRATHAGGNSIGLQSYRLVVLFVAIHEVLERFAQSDALGAKDKLVKVLTMRGFDRHPE